MSMCKFKSIQLTVFVMSLSILISFQNASACIPDMLKHTFIKDVAANINNRFHQSFMPVEKTNDIEFNLYFPGFPGALDEKIIPTRKKPHDHLKQNDENKVSSGK